MNNPNPKPIGEALQTHYAQKSLSTDQLEQLMAMQEAAVDDTALNDTSLSPAGTTAPGLFQRFMPDVSGYRYAFYATACLLVMCLVVTFSLINQAPLSQRIMDEIAYNHKQGMPIEVASSSLDEIRTYLDKLSFPIISPIALNKPNWQFLGGRYCSINGKLAAQLKIKNTEDNSIYTLYQAATEGGESALGQSQMTQTIDGVGVSIWREKGLLLGLASSP